MVVVAEIHWRTIPVLFLFVLEKQFNGDGVMAVGEHVGLDLDLFADHALDRIAAAVDLRADRLDDDARRRLQFLARLQFFARTYSGLKRSTASGGRVSVSEWCRSSYGMGCASAPPWLPMPLPP